MAMGGKKASEQGSPLGQREISQDPGCPELGLCRHRKARRWNATRARPATRIGYANPSAYQDQSQRQSARPRMGALLRVPMGHENAELIKRPCEVLPCLAKAGWHVSDLPGTNHKGHPLGCSSHCEKSRRRVGCSRQPSDAPSQLP